MILLRSRSTPLCFVIYTFNHHLRLPGEVSYLGIWRSVTLFLPNLGQARHREVGTGQ